MAGKSDNDNKPRTSITTLLPEVYKSDVNESVFNQSFDRFLTKDDATLVSGYIGQGNPNALLKRQIPEPTPQLQAYQLQPLAYTQVGNQQQSLTFNAYMKQLEFLGVDPLRMDKWGKAQEFNWIPPINLDMFVNYQNYYWVSTNNQPPNYITIENTCEKYKARVNGYESTLNTFGSNFPILQIDAINNCIIVEGRLDTLLVPSSVFYVKQTGNNPINVNLDGKFFTVISSEYFQPDLCVENPSSLSNKTKICVEQNFAINSPTPPSTTLVGRWWLDTTTNMLYSWNGSTWVQTIPVSTSQISLTEISDTLVKQANCVCSGDYGWDLALWDDNPAGWESFLIPFTQPTEADWITVNGPPIFGSLWVNTNDDVLYQWDGSQWKVLYFNFSQQVSQLTGDVLWDLTTSCFENLQVENQWSQQNKWVHKSQLSSFAGATRAQIPIIEYDSRLKLNEWVNRKYQWKYRTNVGLNFENSLNSPTILELQPIIDYVAVENPPASGEWFLYLTNNNSSVARDLDLTKLFVPGFSFKLTDDGILNDVYTVEYSIARQALPSDPLAVQGVRILTVVKINEPFVSPLSGGGVLNTRIEPVITSLGDPWRGYHVHWLIDENNTTDIPVDDQQLNALYNRSTFDQQPPLVYSGQTILGFTSIGQYFQNITINGLGITEIDLDVSFKYVQQNQLNVIGVVPGLNGSWTIAGDYTSIFTPNTSFVIKENTGITSGVYTVQSAVFSLGNTLITVNETIPGAATPDGVIPTGTGTYALANNDSLCVYVNGVRQYGTYTEHSLVGTPQYTVVGNSVYTTQTFNFVDKIIFNSPLNQFDVVSVQLVPIAYSDYGLFSVPVRTVENEADFTLAVIAGTQPKYKSLVNYLKAEQVKTLVNQYPVFNNYDVCNNSVVETNSIFKYVEDSTRPININIQKRIVSLDGNRNFLFEQLSLKQQDGEIYGFRINDTRVANNTYWFNPTFNQLKYWNGREWETSFNFIDSGNVVIVDPYVGENPPSYLVFQNLSIWYDTINNVVKQSQGGNWVEVAWPEFNNPLSNPTPQGLYIEKTDPTLTTVWRSVDQYSYNSSGPWYQWTEGSYIPQWIDGNRQPLSIGDPNGDWEVPRQWRYNVEHKNKKQVQFSDITTHFASIINAQPGNALFLGVGSNTLSQSEWKYWLGGNIKEYNDSYDTLISSINEKKTTPLTIIEFAQTQYENLFTTIRELYLNSFITLFTNTTYESIVNQTPFVSEFIIDQYESNDFYGFVYGDTSAFNPTTQLGIRNWIATAPMFGLSEKYIPHSVVDPKLQIYQIVCHDGHRENVSLNNEETKPLILKLISTPDPRISGTTYGKQATTPPPTTISAFNVDFQTRTGVYWYNANTKLLYRFEAVFSSTPPSFVDNNGNPVPDGSYYYDTGVNQLFVKSGLSWTPVGPVGEITPAWKIVDLRKTLIDILLEVETRLYSVCPDYQQLVFDYQSLTPDVSEQGFFNQYQKEQFYSYIQKNNISLPFENLQYNPANAFTWNYINSSITTPPRAGVVVPAASWQEQYTRWYSTPYPHIEPWKLQGYVNKPSWWDSEYLDTSNARRWLAVMWTNILAGIVPAGYQLPNNAISSGLPAETTTYGYVSVNISNSCLTSSGATISCAGPGVAYRPDDLLPPYFALTIGGPNATPPNVRSLYTDLSFEIVAPGSNFVYGEVGPVEWEWSVSSEGVYDELVVAFKMQPVRFLHSSFGPQFTRVNNLQVETTFCEIYSHEDALFHGDVYDNNQQYLVRGLNQWYINYNRNTGYDTNNEFRTYWVDWNPLLSYQFSGIIDTSTLEISNRFFDVDQEDFFTVLANMGPIDDVWVDAFQVTVLRTPPKIVQYNNQSQWRLSIDTLGRIPRTISYYDAKVYPYTIDPITNVATAFRFNIEDISQVARIFIVSGDQVTQFVEAVQFTISNSTANDGVYTVMSSVYDPSTDTTRVSVVETIPSPIVDGIIDITDYQLPWSTGQIIFLTAAKLFPAPLTGSREYYLIMLNDRQFKLADSLVNANNGIAIDVINAGSGDLYVGEVDSSFYVLGRVSLSQELWFHYALDKTKIRTLTPPYTVAGFQRILNIIDGYKALQEDKNVRYNLTDVYETDPDTGRTVNWQLEVERLINWAYGLRKDNSLQPDRYDFIVESLSGFQGYQQNGFQVFTSPVDLTGLQPQFYTFNLSVDGGPLITVSVDGSLCVDYAQLVVELNNQLTLLGLNATATFEILGNGGVRISSNTFGPTSLITIVDVDLFNSLVNSLPLQPSVPGTGSLFSFVGSSPSLVNGSLVRIGTSGTVPTGLNAGTTYAILNSSIPGFFELSLTRKRTPSSVVVVSTTGSGTQFISQARTTTQFPSFEINPIRNNVWLNTPQGVLADIIDGPYEDIRVKQTIFDQYGRPLPSSKLLVYRQDKQTRISIVGEIPNDLVPSAIDLVDPYNYIHMGGAHLFVNGYQHIVIFNNYTASNNLVYDQFLGLQTRKFDIQYFEKNDYSLRPTLGGHYLIDGEYRRNIEGQVDDLRNYYDIYNLNEFTEVARRSRNLINFNNTLPYLDLLNINKKSQLEFYRGMIQAKGSTNSINAFINNRKFVSASLDEVWAWKIAEFGDSRPKMYPEIKLFANEGTIEDVRFEFLTNLETLNTTIVEQAEADQFQIISFKDQNRWYEYPDQKQQLNNTILFLDATISSSVSILVSSSVISGQEQSITYWYDTIAQQLKQFDGSVWQNVSNVVRYDSLTNRYYIKLDRICDDVKVVRRTLSAPPNINEYESIELSSSGGNDGFIKINSSSIYLDGNAFNNLLIVYTIVPNFSSINPVKLLDRVANTVVSEVPYWHPAYGQHYYVAKHNIDLITNDDPATYTSSLVQSRISNRPWNQVEVGTIWVDNQYLDYVPYYDSNVFPNINDRLFNWGTFSDIGEARVYQWVQSTVPPQDYEGVAISQISDTLIPSDQKLSGVPKTSVFKRTRTPRVGTVEFLSPLDETSGRGFQDVEFGIPITLSTQTGLPVDNSPGYQEIEWRTSSGVPLAITTLTQITWAQQTTAPYTGIFSIDDETIDVSCAPSPDFNGLLTELNQDLGTAATASIVGGVLRITSSTASDNSTVSIEDINLFNSLQIGVNTQAYQDVFVGSNKIPTSPTSLVAATRYTALIDIDGVVQTVVILGSTAPNFDALLVRINASLTGASASLVGGNLRITTNTTGSNGSIDIIDIPVITPATFTNANVNDTTDVLTVGPIGGGLPTGTPVTFDVNSGTPPAPLVDATVYFVINVSPTEIRLATSYANAISNIFIDITTPGAGNFDIDTNPLFAAPLPGFTGLGPLISGQDAYYANLLTPVDGSSGVPLTMTVSADSVPVQITIDGDNCQTFAQLIDVINLQSTGVFSVEISPSGNLRFVSTTVGPLSTINIVDNNLISSIDGVPSGTLIPNIFIAINGDYGVIAVPYNSSSPLNESDLVLFITTDTYPTGIEQSVKYVVDQLVNVPLVSPTIQQFKIVSTSNPPAPINLVDVGAGVLSVVPAFKPEDWVRKPLVKQTFVPVVDFTTLSPSTITLDDQFVEGDIVNVMVNGRFVLVGLEVNSLNQILVQLTLQPQDIVQVVRREPTLTQEQTEFDPDTEDDGTINVQFRDDFEFTTLTIADIDNNNTPLTLYYYWVQNTTFRVPTDNTSLSPQEIANTLTTIPTPYVVVQKPDDDPTIIETYGYGAIYGLVYSSPYLFNQINVIPVYYRQAILRKAASYIQADDRYTLRFTRDLTLRDNLNDSPSAVNLKNKHTEWTLIREEQPFNIDRRLWDKITESIVGFKLSDPQTRVPSLERQLYDDLYGTDTQYGLGEQQAFVKGEYALATIIGYLQSPNINFAPVDINTFFQQYSFDTPENIIEAMDAIYNTFGYKNVNGIWFEVLSDAFSTKSKYKELFKTSWVALTGVRILEVAGLFDD